MAKPKFENLYFNDSEVVWGRGNDIVGLQIIASLKLRDSTPEELEQEKRNYEEAKEIYERFFNKGQRFKPCGNNANKSVECVITFINENKQTVTWKQDNLPDKLREISVKPAAGKFFINSMLRLVKTGEIEFIN